MLVVVAGTLVQDVHEFISVFNSFVFLASNSGEPGFESRAQLQCIM